MKAIKTLAILLFLILISTGEGNTRVSRILRMEESIERSELVFVGEVKSVRPSGITTSLTYPAWQGVVFRCLRVEIEVIEAVKGAKDGEVVQVLMLSTHDAHRIALPPEMVEPNAGQRYLLCLLRTSHEGMYASITAPRDFSQGIFLLDRRTWGKWGYYNWDGKEIPFQECSERNRLLWDLVDGDGTISPKGAQELRRRYAAEIAAPVSKDTFIDLERVRRPNAVGEEGGGFAHPIIEVQFGICGTGGGILSEDRYFFYRLGGRRDGGTLSGVARLFYGDPSKWQIIFKANSLTVKDPNVVRNGMLLKIPVLSEEKSSAEEDRASEGHP